MSTALYENLSIILHEPVENYIEDQSICKILNERGINLIGELVQFTEKEISSIPGIGEKKLQTLKFTIENKPLIGLCFGMIPPIQCMGKKKKRDHDRKFIDTELMRLM